MIKAYQWEKWSLCNLNVALAEPPDFSAAASNPDVNNAFIYVLGYESLADLKNHWDAMSQGQATLDTGYNCSFPSIHDPYQAPAGRASGVISQMGVYDLADGGSEKWLNIRFREEATEKLLATLEKYAPNMTRDNVLETYITTPRDIENKYVNMVRGGYKQGAYHPLQMGYLRPNQDCSHYRTPVKNLYVGGASVAPGGMIIWGPGYNCANAIVEDYGIEKWWTEPEMVTRAREKNYI
jgi:phytoene dehydrogenase-like protein